MDILAAIKAADLTFRTFILAVMESKDKEVVNTAYRFYSKNGPKEVVETWGRVLERKNYDHSFIKAAVGVISSRVQADLNRIVSKKAFRHPANSISRQKIHDFSMDRLTRTLETSAPVLSQVLKGLLPSKTVTQKPTTTSTLNVRVPGSVLGSVPESTPASTKNVSVLTSSRVESDGSPSPEESVSSSEDGSVLESVLGSEPELYSEVDSDSCSSSSSSGVSSILDNDADMDMDWEALFAKTLDETWDTDADSEEECFQEDGGDNQGSFFSGTTGTIVVGEDLGKDLPPQEEPPVPVLADVMIYKHETAQFKVAYRYHLFKALTPGVKRGTLLSRLAIPPIRVLASRPTEAYELAAMDIDQSSAAGNMLVLEEMRRAIDMDKVDFKDLKMILAGDHLTISRVYTLQKRKNEDINAFDRLKWAIPVLQLFHLMMLLCTSILHNHFGSEPRPGTLRYFKILLERKGLDDDKPSHHLADEFLRTVFTAMVRRMWETAPKSNSCEEESSYDDDFIKDFDNLASNNFTNSDRLFEAYSTTNANAILFLRDMAVYIEFCDAIKEGDVGRLEEILKRITIMIQAGNHHNYAPELLRLRYNIQHKWSETRKYAVFSSLLMNTKGLPHRWIPSDMYQEFNNLLTKKTHATVGHKMSAMAYITPLIRLFHVIHKKMRTEYRLTEESTFHRDVTPEGDIAIVLKSLQDSNILGSDKYPAAHFVRRRVVDVMAAGVQKLSHGGYMRFAARMAQEEDDRNNEASDIERECSGESEAESSGMSNSSVQGGRRDPDGDVLGVEKQLNALAKDKVLSGSFLDKVFK
ncbi:hypothetical protein BGW39_002215 [Mortierella sp. 14UC]|nr:hypothetical protein BGW39_002215 [Mortierella sp. 14UC]